MENLFTYIKKNQDISFSTKRFTEADILLFSQLSYLNLEDISFSGDKRYSLNEIKRLINRKKNKSIFLGDTNVLKLLDTIALAKRYKEVEIMHYVYLTNTTTQFGAMTVRLPDQSCFVSFEGTDFTISGWKEDAALAYQYPTIAQKYAGEYLTYVIRKLKIPIYVCGHSKGGNLAIVGSMRTPIEERNKITLIYSFDGPGLKESEFSSPNYQNIKSRIKHYIPEQSVIGILFLQKKPIVVKSSSVGILQHAAFSWQIFGDYIERGRQSSLSKRLEEALTNWLKRYTLEEREKIVDNLFSVFLNAGITDLKQLLSIKEDFLNFILALDNLSEETKEVLLSFFKLILGEIINDTLA